jgi:trimeric autotransporter adhesin
MRMLILLSLSLLLAGCGGSSNSSTAPPTLVSIAVTPASPTIRQGLKQQFKAMGTYSDSSTLDLTSQATWASATMTVATIVPGGLATGVGVGTSQITAAFDGVTSNPPATLTVQPSSTATPMLVHSLSAASMAAAGDGAPQSGNAFKIEFTGSMGTGTLASNLLVLKITYPSGSTVSSIADNQSSTYTLGPTVTSNTGGANWITSLYYSPGVAAGVNLITVTFSAAVSEFHFSAQEYSGVATSSPADGSCTGTGAEPISCSAAITTTSNGDLIVSSAMDAQNNAFLCGDTSTAIAPGGSFVFDAADPYCSYADAEYVQPTSGSITPSFTFSTNTDDFNIVAMAFKAANSGTNPTGMNIRHLQKVLLNIGAASQPYYFVSTGNLIVATTDVGGDSDSVTLGGCSSGPASPWTKRVPTTGTMADEPQIFFIPNAATSTNLECTATMSASTFIGILAIYDVFNAATSPEDTDSTGYSGAGASLTSAPSVTPTTQPGIAFDAMNCGTGPVLTAGGLFDNTPFTGEVDAGGLNNGDGWQHVFYTSTNAIDFSWTQADGASTCQAFAITFKAASAP